MFAAFGHKFAYAMRAAGDPLFGVDMGFVRACVVAATRRATQAVRATLREGLARLGYLVRHGDRDFPAAALDGFAQTRADIAKLAATPARTTLRGALLQRADADATRAPVMRLAQAYCAALRANEETIALRDVERRRAPTDPGKVARWLTRAAEVSVAATLVGVVAGTFDFAA